MKIKFRVWDWRLKKFNFFDLSSVYGNLPMDSLNNVDLFTGIQDFYGQDIYGGDLISYTQHLFNLPEDRFPLKTKTVAFKEREGKWNIYESAAGESCLKIIGNIYEGIKNIRN